MLLCPELHGVERKKNKFTTKQINQRFMEFSFCFVMEIQLAPNTKVLRKKTYIGIGVRVWTHVLLCLEA